MNKVHIIDREFTVEKVYNLADYENIDVEARTIRIRTGFHHEDFDRYLVHAITHAILKITGLNEAMGERMEEAVCTAMEQFAPLVILKMDDMEND